MTDDEINSLTEKSCPLKEHLQQKEDTEEEFSELKSWFCEKLKD